MSEQRDVSRGRREPDARRRGLWRSTVAGGYVWFGAGGKLVNVELQTIGAVDGRLGAGRDLARGASERPDPHRPDALQSRHRADRRRRTLHVFAGRVRLRATSLRWRPGATQVIPDAFGNVGGGGHPRERRRAHPGAAGNAADLQATVRSTRVTPAGPRSATRFRRPPDRARASGPARPRCSSRGRGRPRSRSSGCTRSRARVGVLTLRGAGRHDARRPALQPRRRTRARSSIRRPRPSASTPEPGDIVRVSVESGSLQPYVNIVDLGTFDVATSVPVRPPPTRSSRTPERGRGRTTELRLRSLPLQPRPRHRAADVVVAFYPYLVTGPPLLAHGVARARRRAAPSRASCRSSSG